MTPGGRVLAIVLLVVFVFAPVVGHDFVNFDDPVYVLDNPIVADGMTWQGLVRAFTTIHAGFWHPLTWVSHMADIELFGFRPGLHHLVNVWLHILSTLLVYGLVTKMTGERGKAAFVAAIFAIHPLRVESVAWVAERKDVLSTFFWLLALVAYVEYVAKPGRGRYVLVLGLFVLGLLAKPMVLTLPVVLLLLDVWPLRRFNRAAILEKLPLLAVSLVAAAVTVWAQDVGGAVKNLDLFPLGHRIANALVSYVAYLGMIAWPVNLAVFYPHHPVPAWQVAGAVAVLGGITWWALRLLGRYPYVAVGWFWYLVTLFPVIGLVQAGLQARADRFTYVPHIGLSLAVAWGAADLLRNRRIRAALPAVATVVVLTLALGARRYVQTWRDNETLWRRALAVTTGNYMAHHNLGVALIAKGQDDRALAELRRALEIWPEFAEAHNTIGNLLARAQNDEAAIAHYRESLRLSPYFAPAHNNLGLALMRREAYDEALSHFQQALDLAPFSPAAHHNLGRVCFARGLAKEAETHYREAIRLRPRYAEAHYSLGEVLAASHRFDEAAAEFRAALAIAPGHTLARAALGNLAGKYD